MKTFTVFYEHSRYGYYSVNIEATDILTALTEFKNDWRHGDIYGIMEVR